MINTMIKPFADPANIKQTTKLIKTNWPVIGVKIPQMRKLAKQIVKQDNQWINQSSFTTYEEIMCYGFCIGYAKIPLLNKIRLLDQCLQLIDNWAHIDCIFGTIKVNVNEAPILWKYVKRLTSSKQEFTVRAGIILILSNFITDEYVDEAIKTLNNISSEFYYINMGLAWTYFEIVVRCPHKGISLIKHQTLPVWVQNKTIQKVHESFRVLTELKDELLKYRL